MKEEHTSSDIFREQYTGKLTRSVRKGRWAIITYHILALLFFGAMVVLAAMFSEGSIDHPPTVELFLFVAVVVLWITAIVQFIRVRKLGWYVLTVMNVLLLFLCMALVCSVFIEDHSTTADVLIRILFMLASIAVLRFSISADMRRLYGIFRFEH